MQLGVREVARLFDVVEKTVYRWVQEDALPAYVVEGQHRFHRTEVLEWATARDLTPSPELFAEDAAAPAASIALALERGGVHHDVPAPDRETALAAIVARLPIGDADRTLVHDVLSTRPGFGETRFGAGIAIPHVRHPIALDVPEALLVLCLFATPLAVDPDPAGATSAGHGQPLGPSAGGLRSMFLLITPSVRTHLAMVSRLTFVAHADSVRMALDHRASAADIISAIAHVEAAAAGGQR